MVWKNKNQRTGEIYDAIICMKNKKMFLIADDGIICYNLDTGRQEWKNDQIVSLYTPLLVDNILISGAKNMPGIYYTDIETGESKCAINTEGYVHLMQFDDKMNLFIITTADKITKKYNLEYYNFRTRKSDKILFFEHQAKNQLEYYNSTLILNTWDDGMVYFIDGETHKIIRKRHIENWTLLGQKSFVCTDNSIFFLNKKFLFEENIKTGDLIRTISLSSSVHANFLEVDNNYILLPGRNLQIYNIDNQNIIEFVNDDKASIDFYATVLDNGNLLFYDNDYVYTYNMEKNSKERIYQLKGMEVYRLFYFDKYVFLILTDNIIETLADNKPVNLILLNLAFFNQ
ncbi:MAG: hypothetical protein LBG80_10775 [Bacteroidales bacterium]|nr:hypothetical protein [Bacteroidales bacterium]